MLSKRSEEDPLDADGGSAHDGIIPFTGIGCPWTGVLVIAGDMVPSVDDGG